MLQVENLAVQFGAQAALAGVSFSVAPGEMVVISGPSGCGKSTLARCLNGLIPHNDRAKMAGRVAVAGLDTREHPVFKLAEQVGLVLQHPEAQLFSLTVEEEVAFGPRTLGLPAEEVTRRVAWTLDALGLEPLRRRPPPALSAGEKERLAIASVLASKPQFLVLDEALANLDADGTRRLGDLLRRLAREEGMGVLLLEHKPGELLQAASRLLLMEAGRIVAGGPPHEVLQREDLVQRLGVRRPERGPEPWRELLVPSDGGGTGEPLLELRGVTAGYGQSDVLRGADLSLARGELAALVGANGAGKSTLARVVAGLLPVRSGEVRFDGRARLPRPGREVALLLENPDEQLFCDTVAEEVRFGAESLGRWDAAAGAEALAAADLAHLQERPPHALSLGQRQRTVMAALMALRPALLILDEPTLGQDWGHLSRFMALIRRLKARGTAALVITHDYKLVCRYIPRVLLMEEGRIVAEGRVRVVGGATERTQHGG